MNLSNQQHNSVIDKKDQYANKLECPIKIFYESCNELKNLSNNELTAQILIKMAQTCESFALVLSNLNEKKQYLENNFHKVKLLFKSKKNLISDQLKDYLFAANILKNKNKTCHFEAVNNNNHNALSACSIETITGVFQIFNHGYFFSYNSLKGTFVLIPKNKKTCDTIFMFNNQKTQSDSVNYLLNKKEEFVSKVKREVQKTQLPNYYHTFKNPRYVELALIADNSIYNKFNQNATHIHDRLQSITNVVNSIYSPLNIHVVLVWADIWMTKDYINIDSDLYDVLRNFLAYRQSTLRHKHPNDHAQLLTNKTFDNKIGKAYVSTICSYDTSGAVVVDHSLDVNFVGTTVAHELGHNLGMQHDVEQCNCPSKICIMEPTLSNSNYSRYFSDCSLNNLEKTFSQNLECLNNVPKEAFGGAKCGNGILEDDEECDCGSTEICPNNCCVPDKCKLAPGAKCATGDCCNLQTCDVKPMAQVCREPTNSCDLPEYCDGENPICPPNFYVQDGHVCPDDANNYCFQGVCGNRDKQCRKIWGSSSRSSDLKCYENNKYCTVSGNCGYNIEENRHYCCQKEDLLCGRLQCSSSSHKPNLGVSYSDYNQVLLENRGWEICRTFVDESNIGMVPDGTKCGDEMMCVNATCRKLSLVTKMTPKCDPTDCNKKGICNNVGNCHCVLKFGGARCDYPGFGGSINSGPASDNVFYSSTILFYFFIVFLILFGFLTYYCKKKYNIWLHKKIWKRVRQTFNIYSTILIPVRRAPPIPGAQIQHNHRFSWNAVWDDTKSHTDNTVTKEILNLNSNKPTSYNLTLSANSASFTKTYSTNVTKDEKINVIKKNTTLNNYAVEKPNKINIKQESLFGNIEQNIQSTEFNYGNNKNTTTANLTNENMYNLSSSSSTSKQNKKNCKYNNEINTNNIVSSRKLMEKIKNNLIDTKTNLLLHETEAMNEILPKVPPHKNKNFNNNTINTLITSKPELMSKPNVFNNMKEKIETNLNKSNTEKKNLSVKELAALFNN